MPSLQVCRDSPETTPYFGSPAFKTLWQRTDQLVACEQVSRSWYWGPHQVSGPIYEEYKEGKDGTRLVQYYEKSRMEINDEKQPDVVTNGLLTVELVSGKMQISNTGYVDRAPANIPLASDNDDDNAPVYSSFVQLANTPLGDHPEQNLTAQTVNQTVNKLGQVGRDRALDKYGVKYGFYNTETRHNISDQVWQFLNAIGPVRTPEGGQPNAKLSDPWFYTSGYAISEPYWANVKIAGKQTDVLIQLFQRRVVTYQPDGASGFKVQMGNIGKHYVDWRYDHALPGEAVIYKTEGNGGTICRNTEPELCGVAKVNHPALGVAYVGQKIRSNSTGTLNARISATKTKFQLLENAALQLKDKRELTLPELLLLGVGTALFDYVNGQGEIMVEANGSRIYPTDVQLLRVVSQLQLIDTIFSVQILSDGSVKIAVVSGLRGVLVISPDGQQRQLGAGEQLVVPPPNSPGTLPASGPLDAGTIQIWNTHGGGVEHPNVDAPDASGGNDTLTSTPTPIGTFAPTSTGTSTRTPAGTLTSTPTGTRTVIITSTPTPTMPHDATPTATMTATITKSSTRTPTITTTVAASITVSPTLSPTVPATLTTITTTTATAATSSATISVTVTATPTATLVVPPVPIGGGGGGGGGGGPYYRVQTNRYAQLRQ
jgi:hypothetical protein